MNNLIKNVPVDLQSLKDIQDLNTILDRLPGTILNGLVKIGLASVKELLNVLPEQTRTLLSNNLNKNKIGR